MQVKTEAQAYFRSHRMVLLRENKQIGRDNLRREEAAKVMRNEC